MTSTTTPRDFRSPVGGSVPNLDSPGASAGARARIAATQSDSNSKTQRSLAGWLARQWEWTARPDSLHSAWVASRVDVRRIPAKATLLRALWLVSNWTDRPLMFALILAAPTFTQGPLRWFAQRPTRRYGFYLTVAALAAALLTGRN